MTRDPTLKDFILSDGEVLILAIFTKYHLKTSAYCLPKTTFPSLNSVSLLPELPKRRPVVMSGGCMSPPSVNAL